MSSSELDDKRIEAQHQRLADELGITADELESLSPQFDADVSDDGHLHGYIVNFSKNASVDVFRKVKGLQERHYTLNLGPNVFDGDDDTNYPEDGE